MYRGEDTSPLYVAFSCVKQGDPDVPRYGALLELP